MKKKILITLSIILILCVGGFGFYVNDYYHAQGDALEILNHQEVKQVNSNLITLTPQKTSDVGIIFYPGAKVENTAYLPLLEQLEKKGYNCYLVNMPFKMAIFNKNAANKIIENYPNIKAYEINGEENTKIAYKYSVFSMPVFLLFIEGKESIRTGKHVDLLSLERSIDRYYNMIY